ncbi:class I adenylate-forming enzyme family protein [Paenibacillus silvae]|uniref:class I adenylate-forming enzyme family protein n=1 Tax=Paenibacillus silvae TaxID=1325358 RepID=UPI00200502C7|nr:class I adenylate-forming enzyme family protein [Paenibacillus silvae]MCK6075119.1 acyl--CoA ligase [Paenibacillus silvae]MCK6149505.1 acyl--CoA ligase [Paenibacillus silvae]MCK6267804.1 acyl--CoA ligase [Paenibacillus silvae]
MLLSERLPLAASLYPEATALLHRGHGITYGELNGLVEKMSDAFYAQGLRTGDRFALLGDPNPELVVALFAAVAIGAIPLVPSPLLTVSELAVILQDAEPTIIIYDEHHIEKAAALMELLGSGPKWFATCEEPAVSGSEMSVPKLMEQQFDCRRNENNKRDSADTAVLIYTGGTTGRPKGVMHSHRGMAAWNQLTPSSGFGYDIGRRVLVLNLSHLVGQFQIWATMAAGGCLVFMDEYPGDVQCIIHAVEQNQITHLSTVGQLLRDLTHEVSRTGEDLRSLKVIGCGGSVIAPDTLQDAVKQFPGAVIVNNYSQAECGMSISRLFPARHAEDTYRLHSVGRPQDLAAQVEQAFEVRIVHTDGRDAEAGESGEIVVRGAQTMIGYWRQPEVTREIMTDGWIRTGDVGCLDDEGYLYVLDRLKDMVIVNGSNVFCAEVEQVIMRHEVIMEAAVVGEQLSDEGERVVAFVVLQDGTSLDLKQLRAFCELHLALYKCPTHLHILNNLPRTSVQKVDKKQLKQYLLAQ